MGKSENGLDSSRKPDLNLNQFRLTLLRVQMSLFISRSHLKKCCMSNASCISFFTTNNVFLDLKRIVGADYVCLADDRYRIDWLKSYVGGKLVCFPKSTVEVSNIMKYCHIHKIPVVPQGGNTGLVGGSIPSSDEQLIISFSRMNAINEIDNTSSVLVCESGCILQQLEENVNLQGLKLPLDLASKGSCMIGGNVSTNAGGIRRLKYGSLHETVLGMYLVNLGLLFICV